MSHFSVLVIGDDPVKQLDLYDENGEDSIKPKWDWYALGGRWLGSFALKEGASGVCGRPGVGGNEAKSGYVDQAKKGDIDWEAMRISAVEDAEKNWLESEKESESKRSWSYGRRPDDTKESFLARHEDFSTYAVLNQGEWLEIKGSPKLFQEILSGVPDDTLLSVYDCHI